MNRLFLSLLLVISSLSAGAQCSFKVIGHRGGSSLYYPENTLISLEQGFMEDIYAAEIDVQATADSVLVLMHDFYIDRTTNGTGYVDRLSVSYLKTLDAGSWKSPKYKNTPIPTLKEALLLANKYQKKLYLNMKIFNPQLVARTLAEAGVAQGQVIVDPDDLDKVTLYHEILPGTPQVYFGALPVPVDNPDFYQFLKNNGVIAIEIPADYVREDEDDDEYERVRDIAHLYGLELWAYTVNDPPFMKYLKDFGIDGLETDRPSGARQVFCNNADGGFFPEKRVTGQWDFHYNLNGTTGSNLVLMGDTTVADQKIQFGTTKSFGLPPIGDSVVSIARIPALDPNHALRFFSNISPEGLPGDLSCDNTYTLVFDLLKPSGRDGYTAIFQTSNNNFNDADLFLTSPGNRIGILEQYRGGFADSTWVRLVLVFDLYEERLGIHLDGNFIGTIRLDDSQDGRFCINNNWGIQSSNFFSDDDGETNPVFVSSIQLRNYAMSEDEIRRLGYPEKTKISCTIEPDNDINCPEFIDEITFSTQGDTITLVAQADDRVNYIWEMNRGYGWESITGTDFKYPASAGFRITGNSRLLDGFLFRCIAFNDCRTVSNEYLLKDASFNLQLPDNPGNPFSICPNPSKGAVNIGCRLPLQSYEVSVYTFQGAEVLRIQGATGNSQIRLDKGCFLVYLRSGPMKEVRLLIIE